MKIKSFNTFIKEHYEEDEDISLDFDKLAREKLGRNLCGGADWAVSAYYLTTDVTGEYYVVDNENDTYSIIRRNYIGEDEDEIKDDSVYTTEDILEIIDLAVEYKNGRKSK